MRNLIKKIEFWTLIFVITAGISNYFFVSKYSAKINKLQADRMGSTIIQKQDELINAVKETEISLNKANEKLINRKLEELNTEISNLTQRLINAEKQAKISLDIGRFIKDLQPNVQIDLEKQAVTDIDDTLTLRFDIKNIGYHTVVIEKPPLALSWEPFSLARKEQSLLIPGTDYLVRNMRVGNIPSGQMVRHIFNIKLINPPKHPFTIYYNTEFKTETDWAIQEMAKKLLVDYLSEKDIVKLSQRSYNRWGHSKVSN